MHVRHFVHYGANSKIDVMAYGSAYRLGSIGTTSGSVVRSLGCRVPNQTASPLLVPHNGRRNNARVNKWTWIYFPPKQTTALFQRAGLLGRPYALRMVLRRSPSSELTLPVRVFPLRDNRSRAVMPVFLDPGRAPPPVTSLDCSRVQS